MVSAVDGAVPQLGNVATNVSFRRVAFIVSAIFVIVAIGGSIVGNVPGPRIGAFLPIVATVWAMAELLTAFFLCSQFYVAGKLSYALIAVGYAFTGMLTLPYLYAFPGVFLNPPLPVGTLQVSIWIWVVWHITFPVVIAATHIVDPTLEARVVSRERIDRFLFAVVAGTTAAAVTVAAVIWAARDRLPLIIYSNGHFSEFYSLVVAPTVVIANLTSCAIVARRLRSAKALQLWVAVALLVSALDGLVNATSPARYTISWYVGKVEALTAASIVLIVLLFEVATLYRRLFDVASIDPLTGLSNRRTLDSVMRGVIALLPRSPSGVSLLMLDLDKFKHFNDRYGHAQGDEVLRVVAGVLRACASRPTDHIVRYGGEEFVLLLADTTLASARIVAERIRAAIEIAPVALGDGTFGSVTASIGIANAACCAAIDDVALFAEADRALYLAKERGRNCVVVASDPAPLPRDLVSI